MKNICVKCPAKINLTLEVVNKRADGFHNIKSVMQLVSLYDYLKIEYRESESPSIFLSGNNSDIPYNSSNLVYKAAELFFKRINLGGYELKINIEKNIPISAGLAGGSTDGAGTLFGLNKLFNEPLNRNELHELAASLGSDLNVCLEGGCLLATSRGEVIQPINTIDMPVSLIKPKNLGISAKESYTKYSQKKYKPQNNMTEKMVNAINNGEDIIPYLYNDLEYAVYDDYRDLQYIKSKYPKAVMSGSGSTYFILEDIGDVDLSDEYTVITGLNFISKGVSIAE